MADDTKEETVKLSDVEKMIQDALDKRDKEHAEELAEVRQMLPTAMVPAHSGGPGVDNHQASWSLAEQEAAARGETLDHWT
jgi:hypothetical protein